MIKFFFIRIIISLLLGFFFVIILSKFISLYYADFVAIFVGTICALIYVISGFFSFYYANSLRQQSFNKVFVTTIALRFLFLLVAIILLIKITVINQAVFLTSFFIWYFIFQILEVISLKNMQTKKI